MSGWKFIKDLHNTMVIDFEKKTIRCAKDAWFKLETKDRVFIFALEGSNNLLADPITKCENGLTNRGNC